MIQLLTKPAKVAEAFTITSLSISLILPAVMKYLNTVTIVKIVWR